MPRRTTRALLAVSLATLTVIASGWPAAASPPNPVPGGGGQAHAGQPPGASRQSAPDVTAQATASVSGIDISAYQHPNGAAINWSSVAGSGVRSVYIKANEGTSYVNQYYAGDALAAKRAGIYVGAYAFARPDSPDPIQQADKLLAVAPYVADGKTLPPMVDLEWPYSGSGVSATCWGLSTAQMTSWIRSFVNRIQARTGRAALIYTNNYWWDPCTGSNTSFGNLPLTIAHYNGTPYPLPAGWSNYTFWQYSASGSVPGINGAVDLDSFNGSLTDLARLAGILKPKTPVAVIDSGSHSNVFAAGTDGKLYQTYNTTQNTWTPWSRVTNAGIITSAPAAIRLPTGEVDVYASGTDHAIYQIRWLPGSGWSGWASLG